MAGKFRKLNEAGIAAFTDYIRDGAEGPPPYHLLESPETSAPLDFHIEPGTGQFDDRYMFGVYLNTLLKQFDAAAISGDKGLWSALALHWFDRLCPPDAGGNRSPKQEYLYALSSDYRHYYRHLVRSPWQLVKDHGEASRFLLIAPRKSAHPLSVHGEILEQFGGRQQVLGSRPIIKAANKLYFDNGKSRPRTGVAGNGRGSARRFGLVLRQLDLTYDPECMADSAFIGILPDEFEKWRKLMTAGQVKAA
ncbi:hypothetical protein NA8A_10138 [Nitratireductor indicus C115]|uniref:Uncharacterized protein n=1 Tax=Nitratireductor indicus C115 TaxID=1231190 RepID=K2N4U4_9HYPH|nr:hypothetical protein [Nitratireductor indicus]EKF42413.1 hypothetical protein NA8A_10138 [Nitratireductor indicus C115]SFQ55737.1 hypothetical protein SAMN05216176_10659 [Nitratireductor indicus]